MKTKLILVIVTLTILTINANNSGIVINGSITGNNHSFGNRGTINNFDAKLKIVQKNQYNQNMTHTKNITNIIQQDPKLLKEIQSNLNIGFTSITTLMKNHRSTLGKVLKILNANSLKQEQIIVKQNQLIYGQKKLLDGQGKLKSGQGMLINGQGKILTNQAIIVDNQGQIYDMQGQVLNNQAYLVDNQGYIMNGVGELIGGQIEMKNILKKIEKFIEEPDIKNGRARMSGFCKRANNMQNINNISFNADAIGRFSNSLDSDRVRCIGKLYKSSHQNLSINLKHADRNTAQKFSDISGINMGNISYEGSKSNTVTVTTTYKPN